MLIIIEIKGVVYTNKGSGWASDNPDEFYLHLLGNILFGTHEPYIPKILEMFPEAKIIHVDVGSFEDTF